MFCITFYSYKGGVGRTLALANVAILLALRGKKVLVVDFDLEAPGLTTLPPFQSAIGKPGLVDFVTDYLKTGKSPDASQYIYTCVIDPSNGVDESFANENLSVDVMPAGIDDEKYGERLNCIDWGSLYRDHHGFLLMEDLRARWKIAGYDYVLIDSRTGHTDVGGICTRQLPDVVVPVFFPNEQNLKGLCHVVQGVRNAGARPYPIRLLFAASRLPRLDDEHGFLRNWLERFKRELNYNDGELIKIEHYDSLMLLDQALFVLKRPKSGLSQQYRNLEAGLSRLNPEDADGVLAYLKHASSEASYFDPDMPTLINELDRIADIHAEDGIVQFSLANVYLRYRQLNKAVNASERALNYHGRSQVRKPAKKNSKASVHSLRLQVFTELGQPDEAIADAEAILNDVSAAGPMLVDAILAIAAAEQHKILSPFEYPAIANAKPNYVQLIVRQLADLPSTLELAAKLAEDAISERQDVRELAYRDPNDFQLALIASQRFEIAAQIGSAISETNEDLPAMFNTAMALWGRNKRPPLDLFSRFVELFEELSAGQITPNWLQCQALAYAALGNKEECFVFADKSLEIILKDKQRDFSSWTYFTVNEENFIVHLKAIKAFADGSGPPPAVFGWSNSSAS